MDLGGGTGLVVATDYDGNFDWAKTYGDETAGGAVRSMSIDDAGHIHLIIRADNEIIHVVKLDNEGNTLQSGGITSGFDNDLYFSSHTVKGTHTMDNGILMVVERGSQGLAVIKFDMNYNFEWAKNIFIGSSVAHTSIVANPDNSILIYGNLSINSFGFTNARDLFATKLSDTGSQIWSMRYGGVFEEISSKAVASPDGGYCMTGFTKSNGNGSHDYSLVKIDSIGAVEWAYTYGRPWSDKAYGLTNGLEEGYVISGMTHTESTNLDSTEVYLVKTDENGISDCQYNAWDILSEPIEETDEVPMIYPEVPAFDLQSETIPQQSYTLKERAYCGFDHVSVEEETAEVKVYPNPAGSFARIQFTNADWSMIELIDMRGETVRTLASNYDNEITINRGSLPSGIYALRVHFPGKNPSISRLVFR